MNELKSIIDKVFVFALGALAALLYVGRTLGLLIAFVIAVLLYFETSRKLLWRGARGGSRRLLRQRQRARARG